VIIRCLGLAYAAVRTVQFGEQQRGVRRRHLRCVFDGCLDCLVSQAVCQSGLPVVQPPRWERRIEHLLHSNIGERCDHVRDRTAETPQRLDQPFAFIDRALLGELYLAAGMGKEALVEFEASQKVVPNRFRTLAGAAKAARESGSVEAAKRYYRALTALVVGGDGDRPEISEARTYLAQN
jgi:hypothetical protein